LGEIRVKLGTGLLRPLFDGLKGQKNRPKRRKTQKGILNYQAKKDHCPNPKMTTKHVHRKEKFGQEENKGTLEPMKTHRPMWK